MLESLDKWLVPREDAKAKQMSLPERLSSSYARNNPTDIGFIIFFLAVLVALFAWRATEFGTTRNVDGTVCWAIIIARGCGENSSVISLIARAHAQNPICTKLGQCLNLLCTVLALLMCRPFLTLLRKHGGSVIFPIDHHVFYHKMTGVIMFGFAAAHTIAHFINIGIVQLSIKYSHGDTKAFTLCLIFPSSINQVTISRMRRNLRP